MATLRSVWKLATVEGDDWAVFDVSRWCVECHEVGIDHERISLRHPGGVFGAKADRDSMASAAHECRPRRGLGV